MSELITETTAERTLRECQAYSGGVVADNRNLHRVIEGLRLERDALRAAAGLAREALGLVETESYDHGQQGACAWCREEYKYVYDKDFRVKKEYQPHNKDCPRQLALAALDAVLGEKDNT